MINRRSFIKLVSFSIPSTFYFPNLLFGESILNDDKTKKFEWRVPQANYEIIKTELIFKGKIKHGEKDTKGLPLVFIFVGIVLIPSLVKAIIALRRDIVYGGVLIDTRQGPIQIDTDKSLSSGVIVVVTPEGTKLYERDEIVDPTELVNVLLRGTK